MPNTPLAVPRISHMHHGLLKTAPKLLAAGNLWVKAGLKFSFVDNLPLLPHIHSRLIDAKQGAAPKKFFVLRFR